MLSKTLDDSSPEEESKAEPPLRTNVPVLEGGDRIGAFRLEGTIVLKPGTAVEKSRRALAVEWAHTRRPGGGILPALRVRVCLSESRTPPATWLALPD